MSARARSIWLGAPLHKKLWKRKHFFVDWERSLLFFCPSFLASLRSLCCPWRERKVFSLEKNKCDARSDAAHGRNKHWDEEKVTLHYSCSLKGNSYTDFFQLLLYLASFRPHPVHVRQLPFLAVLFSHSGKMKLFVIVSLVFSIASAKIEVRPSGLQIEQVYKPDACDKIAKRGQILSMHYTGTLTDGFDLWLFTSSRSRL